MIDILITIGLGCYALGKAAEENTKTMNNKQEARANGCPYYLDSRGKYWSTYTGEQCFFDVSSPTHNGHDIIIGMKSKTIYKDFTQDKLDAQNREFERQGKPFRLKEYTEVKDETYKRVTWKSTFWLYDPIKGKPYKLELTREYPRKPERFYTKVYLKPERGTMHQDFSIPMEYMSVEEARKWRP